MRLEDPPADRRRFELIGLAMAAVIGVTAVGFFTVVILSASDGGGSTPAPAATEPPQQTVTPTMIAEGIRLLGPVEVRSGPASDVAIITRLAATDAIHLLGRSEDSAWLVIGLESRPDVTGWIPAEVVSGANPGELPVIADSTPATSTEEATLSPDLPDLVVLDAFSQQNQLWVRIANQGVVDAVGDFIVSIDGGEGILLDVKPGEPLRPEQQLEAAIPDFYLQLRRNVSVTLLPIPELEEESTGNNTWEGIVGPDLPNDIEIVGASVEGPGEHLVVTIRNNSPIPIAGTFTVSVREASPGTELLGRERVTIDVASEATVDLDFEEIVEIDLAEASIILSTDAIDDAILANNNYPR